MRRIGVIDSCKDNEVPTETGVQVGNSKGCDLGVVIGKNRKEHIAHGEPPEKKRGGGIFRWAIQRKGAGQGGISWDKHRRPVSCS